VHLTHHQLHGVFEQSAVVDDALLDEGQ